MGDLITPAMLAISIGSGLATNVSQAGGLSAYRKIATILSRGRPRENHDILKATHAAFVTAMEVMTQSARKLAADGSADDRAAAKSLSALCSDPTFRDFRYDGEHFPLEDVFAAIDRMFAGGLRHSDGLNVANEDLGLNRLIVRDLAAWGVALPPLLEALFVDGIAGYQPWHIVFRASFAEQVKTNGPAFRILTFERLGELREIGITLIDEVEGIHDRLDRIEEMLRQILRRLPANAEAAAALAGCIAIVVLVATPSMLPRQPDASNSVSDYASAPAIEESLESPADTTAESADRRPTESVVQRPSDSRDALADSATVPRSELQEREAAARLQALAGVWGEPGCRTTYTIRVTPELLTMDALEAPPEAQPYRLHGRVVMLGRDPLEIIVEPQSGDGPRAAFTYIRRHASERLIWHRPLNPESELRRCG